MTATRSELQAWLDTWNENHAAPSADSVADFLGIELAPEPTRPVGQRRRSPEGAEVVKTDDDSLAWRKYRGSISDFWFDDDEVADWEVITDAPECDREHLPEGCVPINLSGWADDDLSVAARIVGSGEFSASLRAELARRGES